MATDIVCTPEQREVVQSTKGHIATSLRTLALACGIAFTVNSSLAQTAPVSSSPSVSLQETKGYGQIDTPFGKLSFIEIRNHPKKDEILDDIMTSEQSKAYNQWIKGLAQVAIKEADTVTERKQVAIEKLSDTAVNLANTVRTALSSGIKLTPDYKETMKKIIAFGKPPETVKYFQEVLANPNNFSV